MTGSLKPSSPQTPNGGALSSGQAYGDVQTAIGNTIMANANEQNPYGSVNYSITGNKQIQIPIFNNQGAFQGMQTIDIPQFNKSTTLTPAGQQLLDQQNQIGTGLNNLAISQTNRLQDVLGQPVSATGLPARANSYGAAPTFQNVGSGPTLARNATTFADTGTARTTLPNSDYGAQRKSVEDAIYSRINPQIDRDRAALETKLVNQGLVRGTEAFNTAMDESNRQANDARMQAVLAGGAEQSRLAGLDLQAGQFFNAGQDQNFAQANQRGMFGLQAIGQNNQAAQQEYGNQAQAIQANNQTAQQVYGNAQAAAQFANENRNQSLQELLTLRNQPINEITALLGGSQVNLPQFQPFSAGTIAQPQISQNVWNAAAMDQSKYQQQMQQTNALLGALGGVAGAGLYGLGKKYG